FCILTGRLGVVHTGTWRWPMKLALALVVLLLATGPASADTITSWAVDYLLSGDISSYTKFYPVGSYDFLLGPGYTTVYRQDPGGSVFLGFYGNVQLPDDLPIIAFPVGTDQAIAYRITVAGS